MALGKLYHPSEKKPNLNILIYGDVGAGKTLLSMTAQDHPALKDVLYVNCESGDLTIRSRPGFQAIDVFSADDLQDLFWELRKAFSNPDSEFAPFQTVVLDTISELQTKNMEEIAQGRVDNKSKSGEDPNDYYQDDYQISNTWLTRLIRWYRDCPLNFIVLAHTREERNKAGTVLEVRPAVSPAFNRNLQAYMDFVWYMYEDTDDQSRHLLTRDSRGSDGVLYRAKTRGKMFAEKIGYKVDNPNIPEIYNTLIETESLDVIQD